MRRTNTGGKRLGAGRPTNRPMRPKNVEVTTKTVEIVASDLSDRQKMAARLMAMGCYSQAKVAKMVDVSEMTIGKWMEVPEFQGYKELEGRQLFQDSRKVFEPMLPNAISKYYQSLDEPDVNRDNLAVARDVFDRVFGRVTIGASAGTTFNLQINILDTQAEKAYGEGEVIDGDCKFVETE
jgi:hypothetical protein